MPKTPGLIGRKVGMTRIFSEDGSAIPVTVVEAGSCVVVQKKSEAKEGYNAIQVGFLEKKSNRVNRPVKGHCKASGAEGYYCLKEFHVGNPDDYKIGQRLSGNDFFQVGDVVDVSGTTKGRGYQGVIKRHGFTGGCKTHGSMFHRSPGSIGNAATPSKVIKGKKLPGRMGNKNVTKQNVMVIDIRDGDDLMVLKGSLPGNSKDIVQVYSK